MLITCPHCGKQISDKAKQCIHCNAVIAEQQSTVATNAEIDYLALSAEKQKSLQEEFFKEFPQHKKTLKTHEKLTSLYAFAWLGAFLCSLLCTIATKIIDAHVTSLEESTQNLIFFLSLGLLGGTIIALICFLFEAQIFKKKRLIVYKLQKQWLEDRNIVNFAQSIALTQKEYKNINTKK